MKQLQENQTEKQTLAENAAVATPESRLCQSSHVACHRFSIFWPEKLLGGNFAKRPLLAISFKIAKLQMPRFIAAVTAFFGFCSLANAQQPPEPAATETPKSIVQVIDFKLTPHNTMVVKAILNETDSCDLMFHTAVDSVSLIEASTPKLKSVQFTHEGNAIAWGGEQTSRYSPKNKIQIGDRTWSNIAIAEDRYSGIGTDGKFGWELFDDQVVEIDFDHGQIKVHSELPDLTGYTEFKTEFDRGGMKIECAIDVGGKNVPHRFLVHSGFSGTALFDDQFTATHKLHDRWQSSPGRDLKDSLGNVISTSRIIVPSISIGVSQLKNVPAELFPGNIRSQKISVIGSDLLKRFNLIVDTDREHIYLKPNRNFETDFPTAKP